jgi:hypothetical protein
MGSSARPMSTEGESGRVLAFSGIVGHTQKMVLHAYVDNFFPSPSTQVRPVTTV